MRRRRLFALANPPVWCCFVYRTPANVFVVFLVWFVPNHWHVFCCIQTSVLCIPFLFRTKQKKDIEAVAL